MYLKSILTLLIISIINCSSFGQDAKIKYPKTKIRLGAGISYSNFFGKQPSPIILCFEGCSPLSQSTQPSFTLGGQVNFSIKRRHYLGFGYRWHQIRIEQELIDFFNNNNFTYKTNLNYHSLSLIHQFQINPSKKYLWWSNSIGTDMNFNEESLIKKWPIFYRTSLSFPFRIINNRGPAVEPFFQIGLTRYTTRFFDKQALMRPFMIGLMINIPCDIY